MADLAALAKHRAAPPPDVAIAQLRKDKKEAVRLARLKVKASNRGAAPPPPGKGGGAPPPKIANATPGVAPKVGKYRAVEDHSGECNFEKGATLFVLGEPDASGNVMAVVGGVSGNVPFAKLVPITDELLAKERVEKEAALTAAREKREKELEAGMDAIEAEEKAKLEALDAKTRANLEAISAESGMSPEESLAAAAKAQAAERASKEIQEMKDEEDRLMAEAKKLEELMAALDMSDDEDDAL